MNLISVIVPVYNVEAYLGKCVDSILNQSYTNIEVILVDDGSTDNSGVLCDQYALRDSRVKVIHKTNGGLSDARNAGLDICTGEYIGFVDSDDYIDIDMYSRLYDFLERKDLDVVMCSSVDVYESHKRYAKNFISYVLEKKDDVIKDLFINKFGGLSISVCNKLFKRQVLINERFEYGKTSEDVYFVLKWIKNVKRFGRIDFNGYFYFCRSGSITHLVHYKPSILEVIDAYEKNYKIISVFYKDAIIAGKYRLFWSYKVAISQILDCSDANEHIKEISFLQSYIRENILLILNRKILTSLARSEFLGYFLLACSYKIFLIVRSAKRKFGKGL